jgi:Ca2+:H+ antiporter
MLFLNWSSLLNSYRNAVKLTVSIIAITEGQYVIAKTSLIGSMLSNLLLVMGMCFFFGGLRRTEQFFNVTIAQTAASLLALATASIIIPTAFDISTTTSTEAPIAEISRGTAVILLIVYSCYLFFQLKKYHTIYIEEHQKAFARPCKSKIPKGSISNDILVPCGVEAAQYRTHPSGMDILPRNEPIQMEAYKRQAAKENEEANESQLSLWVALFTLAASIAIILPDQEVVSPRNLRA